MRRISPWLRSRSLTSIRFPTKPLLTNTGRVSLSAEEEKVFESLLDFRDRAGLSHIELRVVGGWCRDKLLSIPTGDIDVCLSSITGSDFVNKIFETSPEDCPSFQVVSSNPEKSKHLETAVLRVADHEVDLSHMRTEAYSNDSRIPTIGFGTPEEDAMRRDCTINALYYNLETRQVEDPTGMGLKDLETQVIRTANSDPLLTLHEDPLRLLRLIRFASSLEFALAPELKEAFSDPALLDGLEKKVSRERILIEFDKMLLLHSRGYQRALELLMSVKGLMQIVLWPGVKWTAQEEVNGEWIESLKMLANARLASLILPHQNTLPRSLQKRLMWPNERRHVLEKLVDASQRLKGVIASEPSPTELAMWARDASKELWKLVFTLTSMQRPEWGWTRLGPHFEEILKMEDRLFLPPLIRGDELARELGLKGPEIHQGLRKLVEWQMTAPELSKEKAWQHMRA